MTIHVSDTETDRLVRELARRRGVGITEAVRQAVAAELELLGSQKSELPDEAFLDPLPGEEDK